MAIEHNSTFIKDHTQLYSVIIIPYSVQSSLYLYILVHIQYIRFVKVSVRLRVTGNSSDIHCQLETRLGRYIHKTYMYISYVYTKPYENFISETMKIPPK